MNTETETNLDLGPSPEQSAVEKWTDRIVAAKAKWEDDYQRMRENEEFYTGLQWDKQKKIRDDKYVCNITLQRIQQKVATLYARNPTAIAVRRRRLDFQIWDGRMETLAEAVQGLAMSLSPGAPPNMQAMAVLADYKRGKQWQDLVQKVCESLETVYQYECDRQEPDFKESMKEVVRTAIVCGVGYVRLSFVRGQPAVPSATQAPQSQLERIGRARAILDKIESGDIEKDDAEVEQLRLLASSFGVASSSQDDVQEGLVFDFPPATSIIPDPKVTSLKTFRGARWICQEYMLPLDEVNAFFGTDIKVSGNIKTFGDDGVEDPQPKASGKETDSPVVALWEVMNILDRTHFFIIEGYKQYVMAPEPLQPDIKRFWPVFSLTFNDVVVDSGSKVSPFPPSDVDMMYHPQKEWNRSRHGLRGQRRANAPKYIVHKGVLTKADKDALDSAKENEVIELEGIPRDQPPDKFILPVQHAAIDVMAYDTRPLTEDMMLGAGAQEANLGYAKPDVTATVGTIAEQSRMTVASSNVEDLDGLLTRLADSGKQMLLKEMSPDTVKRIAGVGAVFPLENREDFLNEINLSVVAASSGRPNKAIEIANFERVAPLLIQAGANPMFVIREAVKRLDDRLDVSEAFPPPMPMMGQGQEEQAPGGEGAKREPKQPNEKGEKQMMPPANVVPMQMGPMGM